MRRSLTNIGLAALLAMNSFSFVGCQNSKRQDTDTNPRLQTNPTDVAIIAPTFAPIELEAEEATFYGKVSFHNNSEGFSGTGYITGFENEGDACEFKLNIETEGFYDLNFVSQALGGYKENYVFVNGEKVGNLVVDASKFADSKIERVFLLQGENTINVAKYWGYINIDKLILTESKPIDPAIYDIPATLVNQNATDNAKRLMSYMTDIYGEKFLSGQYCDTGMYGIEMATIWKTIGNKFPAVLGLDFMDYSLSRVENGSKSKATEYAVDFWDKGGIVTFCWHWNAPKKYLTGTWYRGFYTEETNIDLEKIMNGQDQEGYDLLMQDIDAIAKQLKTLQDAQVPILWRPLHEASGGWFWWGAKGSEAYKKLYILLYEKLTNEYNLNNLIWVWNGQHKDWYPGDQYVDIIGEDIYPGEKVYTSQIGKFLEAMQYTEAKKMIILSENGCLFDPDLAIRDGAMWGLWATWGGEFVSESPTLNWLSEQYTEEYMVKKVYDHDAVITLDELPDLKTYTIRE